MNKKMQHIVESTLNQLIVEQNETPNQEIETSVFSPQEQRFLGSFAAAGSKHIGILYSISEIGIREFVARSGKQYGCTPAILLSMLRDKYIKIVPYTGYGRDTDYTIELQLPLESVQQYAALLGKKDGEEDAAAGGMDTSTPSGGGGGGGGLPPIGDVGGDLDLGDAEGAAGAPEAPEGEEAPEEEPTEEPAPEVAHVVKYGDLLRESVSIAKQLITEASKSKKKSSKEPKVKIYTDKARILKRLPKGYVHHLTKVIETLMKRTYTKMDKERLIADILDNMQVNFDLTPKQMHRSYEFFRNQRRLQKFLDED